MHRATTTLLALVVLTLVFLIGSPSTATFARGAENATTTALPRVDPKNSILDNIRAIPALSMLAKGLNYPHHAHLRTLLASCRDVNYTVFAPTNWAVLHAVAEFNRTLIRSGYPSVNEIKKELKASGRLNASGNTKDTEEIARPEGLQINDAAFTEELDVASVALFANPADLVQHCATHAAEFAIAEGGGEGANTSSSSSGGVSPEEEEQTRHDVIPKGFNITNLILRYSKSAALYHVVIGSHPAASLPAHAFLPTLLRNDSALVALNGEPQRLHVENITAAQAELSSSTPKVSQPYAVPSLNYSTAVNDDAWSAAEFSADNVETSLETHSLGSLADSGVESSRTAYHSRLQAMMQRWHSFDASAANASSSELNERITPIKVLFGVAYDPIPMWVQDRLMRNATWPPLGVERYIANVVVPDIPCANGLIHIIDRVIEVPMNASLQLRRANFSNVANVLNKTNLTEQLHTMQNITLFVPSNQAVQTFVQGLGKNVSFAALSSSSSEMNGWTRLLHVLHALESAQPIQQLPADNPNGGGGGGGGGGSGDAGKNNSGSSLTADDVKKILLHHIVQGAYRPPEVPLNATLTTLSGGSLNLTVVNGSTVLINNASITKFDILLRNGVMHEIDQVLVPEGIPGVSKPAGGKTGGASGGGGGGAAGNSGEAGSSSNKFTLFSVDSAAETTATTATTATNSEASADSVSLATPAATATAPPALGGVTVGLVQLPSGSAAPVYTAEVKFANSSVSVVPPSNFAAINATTLGCPVTDLVCMAVDKLALECVTQLNLMSESEKRSCAQRAFRYAAMTDPATGRGGAGNWGIDPLLNLPRAPTCYNPRLHSCVNGNFLCPLDHPFLCGAQCYSKNDYVCYSSFSMCPRNASSKCGFACYNEEQYACERGKLVGKASSGGAGGGGAKPKPTLPAAAPATTASSSTGANVGAEGVAGAVAGGPGAGDASATPRAFFRSLRSLRGRDRN